MPRTSMTFVLRWPWRPRASWNLTSVHFALTSGYFFDMRRKSCAAASWDLPVIAAATSTTLICGGTVAVFRIWQTLSLPSNAASCLDNEHIALALHCTLLSCVECFTRWAQIQHWWATNPVVQFSCSRFGFSRSCARTIGFSIEIDTRSMVSI